LATAARGARTEQSRARPISGRGTREGGADPECHSIHLSLEGLFGSCVLECSSPAYWSCNLQRVLFHSDS
jgi:hypothetical protein